MYHRRMDKAIFELLAARLRSQEPVRTAAKLVLIHGLTASEACKIAGVKPPSLSRSLKGFRDLDAEIRKAYKIPTAKLDD